MLMYIPRRIKFYKKRKNREKHLPQLRQKRRRKNKLLFNLQQIKVGSKQSIIITKFNSTIKTRDIGTMFNEHHNVIGECKGTYEVFLKGFNFIMVHKCVENVSLTKLHWKCVIGAINRNHLFTME